MGKVVVVRSIEAREREAGGRRMSVLRTSSGPSAATGRARVHRSQRDHVHLDSKDKGPSIWRISASRKSSHGDGSICSSVVAA